MIARSRRTIGRNEASVTLQMLLHHHHGEIDPGAVDITNGTACDWLRWVAGVEGASNVFRGGVHRVYAVRWQPRGAPEAVFCYGNCTYSTLAPTFARYTGARNATRFELYGSGNWATEPLLSEAPVACTI